MVWQHLCHPYICYDYYNTKKFILTNNQNYN